MINMVLMCCIYNYKYPREIILFWSFNTIYRRGGGGAGYGGEGRGKYIGEEGAGRGYGGEGRGKRAGI